LSTLRGSAHKAIEGISVTNANYSKALAILTKRYDDQNIIKRHLYSELRNNPPSSPKTPDLRKTLESIDRVCRQLSSLGEDLEQQTLTMLILEKLPQNILIELGKMKIFNENWHVDSLREALNSIIMIKEEAYQILQSSPTKSTTDFNANESFKPRNDRIDIKGTTQSFLNK